jgi:hypothetical protein
VRGTAGLAALIVVCCLLAACGSAPARSSSRSPAPRRAVTPTPLATSLSTPSGTWVTVPMGHPDQPLNVFWQLFVRRAGSTLWTDVTSFAVATNGGLVLAPNGARALLVGVRPTNLLSYSPVASSSSGGRSWSPGAPVGALAPYTDALAATGGGELALIEGKGGEAVTTESGHGASTTLTTEAALASARGTRACGLTGLTAVAFGEGAPLVGAGCSRPGVAGILSYRGGSWKLDSPVLPAPFDAGAVEVVSLTGTPTGASALLEVTGRFGVRLVAAFSSGASRKWRLSGPLSLVAGSRLLSVGRAGSGYFLLSSASGRERLDATDGPGDGWSRLPAPPAGTATAAFSANGTVDSFVPRDSTLTVWSLAPSRRWTKSEVINVPIQYGSAG